MDLLNTPFTEISSSAINLVSIATLLKLYIICLQALVFHALTWVLFVKFLLNAMKIL